ncbi:thioesterase family protein [Nocardia sp. NPDC055321]
MNTTSAASAYFQRVGPNSFVPTVHAGGAWNADEQHFSPLGGLIVHEIQRARARAQRPALALSRISFDILGRIGFEEFGIAVRTVRPGRTIELVEAVVTIAGRDVVNARAWLLSEQDTASVAGGEPDRLPDPEALPSWPLSAIWSGGYIASVDTRAARAYEPGRNTAWVRSTVDLVAGEPVDPLAGFIALVDTANGIAVRRDPAKWMFPNLDLTIHLHRQPRGAWTGLDTGVTFGQAGQGLTSTVLHDVDGPVGVAQQILTVRPQP